MAKYRVTLSSYQYHTVDVEANSPDEAEKIVNTKVKGRRVFVTRRV